MIAPKYESQRRRRSLGKRSKSQVELVRDGVYLRDDFRCLAAHSFWDRGDYACVGGISIQHAIGKGMGGSALFDNPVYLRTFCIGHNVLETSSADFHAFCVAKGWSLSRNRVGQDPESVPVRYPDGRDYQLLAVDYGRRLLTHDEAAEMRALNGIEGH